ncbi:MAG TPA: site-specific DNA-methyltransferase [Alicycliphilus sp.]|nr:site-specific DNA-methyltransferase [Alicycliphilus sp.]
MPDLPLLQRLEHLSAPELRRLLTEQLTRQKLGLYWERDAIAHDRALNADVVLPRLVPEASHTPAGCTAHANLIIEGDNFDALRLLRATHAGKVRVIYIDPPYNTGNKDWVYNDQYVGANDRWRHSQWLEFLYQRLLLARDLLTSDGVILVSINDENRARLELLMDEVFPGRRLGSLVWRTKDTGNDLAQRFSHVHEHVLVYANGGFSFNGRATDRSKFRNPDNDPRGEWSPQPLTANKSLQERPNTYYPIQNPETGYWYPCDPNSVWRFASEAVICRLCNGDAAAAQSMLSGLRSDSMEALIAKRLIYFPPCKPEEVMTFATKADLLAAIKAGKGPVLPKKKTPLLRADLPDLDFWVGKPIATGRPSRKEHWTARPESERLAPLGSWIAGMNEDVDDDELEQLLLLRSTRGGVATEEVKNVLGSKAFHYPKPLSLIKNLLAQATRPGDTVLDFFAGSGTTGQAVLELNAEDGGQRRFILCSSTEATAKEPAKNLCRDVCAERLRRVIQGYGGKSGYPLAQGGEFAYLQLDKFDGADVLLDAEAQHAATLLSMRNMAITPVNTAPTAIFMIVKQADWLLVLCQDTAPATLAALGALHQEHPGARLLVVSPRPKAVALWLAEQGIAAQTQALHEVLTLGQGGRRYSPV